MSKGKSNTAIRRRQDWSNVGRYREGAYLPLLHVSAGPEAVRLLLESVAPILLQMDTVLLAPSVSAIAAFQDSEEAMRW